MAKRIISLIMVVALSMSMFMLVGCDSFDLNKYKEDKKTEIESYATGKGEDNYYNAEWQDILGIVENAKAEIDLAEEKSTVDTILSLAKEEINKANAKQEATGIEIKFKVEYLQGNFINNSMGNFTRLANSNEELTSLFNDYEMKWNYDTPIWESYNADFFENKTLVLVFGWYDDATIDYSVDEVAVDGVTLNVSIVGKANKEIDGNGNFDINTDTRYISYVIEVYKIDVLNVKNIVKKVFYKVIKI